MPNFRHAVVSNLHLRVNLKLPGVLGSILNPMVAHIRAQTSYPTREVPAVT